MAELAQAISSNCEHSADCSAGPWNPGIRSQMTRELLTRSTIFRLENVFHDLKWALEFRDVTGLPLEDLAIFRPERLALHALLAQVTADYEVPDPEHASIGSLGTTLRRMARTLATQVIDESQAEINKMYAKMRKDLETLISAELSASFGSRLTEPKMESGGPSRGLWAWLRRSRAIEVPADRGAELEAHERILCRWAERATDLDMELNSAAFRALLNLASAIRVQHGRILGEKTFLAALATDLACNELGAKVVSRFLEPRIRTAAQQAGFRRLPAQARPVAMVTKGASASGKSTMRPLQRKLAARMGLSWDDFALVSPDIWRRILLDFDTLGSIAQVCRNAHE